METLIKYDNEGNIEYVLKAPPGSLLTEKVWQITKIFYSGGNLIRVSFANNDNSFSFMASEYLSYKYSAPIVTIIEPLENIASGFSLDFLLEDPKINRTGGVPEITTSAILFNAAEFIVFSYNEEQLMKGTQVQWSSVSSLVFNIPLIKGQSIIMRS